MGKKAEQNKLTSNRNGVQLEHNTVYDDNLLPSAEELAKLQAVNPDIIKWIMSRTEVEQNARIAFNKKRANLVGREINYAGLSTLAGLIMCFVLLAGFFYLSYDFCRCSCDKSTSLGWINNNNFCHMGELEREA